MNIIANQFTALQPAKFQSFIIIFVGVLSSVPPRCQLSDPVPGRRLLSMGRHPLVGLACGAGVAAVATVNLVPAPIDAMLTGNNRTNPSLPGRRRARSPAANLFSAIGIRQLFSLLSPRWSRSALFCAALALSL